MKRQNAVLLSVLLIGLSLMVSIVFAAPETSSPAQATPTAQATPQRDHRAFTIVFDGDAPRPELLQVLAEWQNAARISAFKIEPPLIHVVGELAIASIIQNIHDIHAIYKDDGELFFGAPSLAKQPKPQAVAEAGGFMMGRITDEAGSVGLANVRIDFSRLDSSGLFSTTSDANGYYTSGLLLTGTYAVSFNPAPPYYAETYDNWRAQFGFTPVTVTATYSATSINAALRSGYLISGTVMASAPLSGVFVSAYRGQDSFATVTTYSRQNGSYQLGPLESGRYHIRFNPPQPYLPEWYNDVSNDLISATFVTVTNSHVSGIDATITQGNVITGFVKTTTNIPLPKTNVYVYAPNNDVAIAFAGANFNGQYTTTPALPDGIYQIQFVPSFGYDHYQSQWYDGQLTRGSAGLLSLSGGITRTNINAFLDLRATATPLPTYTPTRTPTPGFSTVTATPTRPPQPPPPPPTQTPTPSITTGGVITGQFITEAGSPAIGYVSVYNSANAFVSFVSPFNGNYQTQRLYPGVYRLSYQLLSPRPPSSCVQLPIYYNTKTTLASADPVTVTAGMTTTNINQIYPPQGIITGLVTGAGLPLAGAKITAQSSNCVRTTYSAPDGSYLLSGLSDGAYTVLFAPPNRSPLMLQWYNGADTPRTAVTTTVTFSTTTPNINANLVTGSIISGNITLADSGAPAWGAVINTYDAVQDKIILTTYADMAGRYQTTGLTTGAYLLQFTPGPWSNYLSEYYNNASYSDAQPFYLFSSGITSNINATLDRYSTISGFAFDQVTGQTLQNVAIELLSVRNDGSTRYGSSNSFGLYQFSNLPIGQYRIRYQKKDYLIRYYPDAISVSDAQIIAVGVGTDITDLNLSLSPWPRFYLPFIAR